MAVTFVREMIGLFPGWIATGADEVNFNCWRGEVFPSNATGYDAFRDASVAKLAGFQTKASGRSSCVQRSSALPARTPSLFMRCPHARSWLTPAVGVARLPCLRAGCGRRDWRQPHVGCLGRVVLNVGVCGHAGAAQGERPPQLAGARPGTAAAAASLRRLRWHAGTIASCVAPPFCCRPRCCRPDASPACARPAPARLQIANMTSYGYRVVAAPFESTYLDCGERARGAPGRAADGPVG